jgi:hypothetical protein
MVFDSVYKVFASFSEKTIKQPKKWIIEGTDTEKNVGHIWHNTLGILSHIRTFFVDLKVLSSEN